MHVIYDHDASVRCFIYKDLIEGDFWFIANFIE